MILKIRVLTFDVDLNHHERTWCHWFYVFIAASLDTAQSVDFYTWTKQVNWQIVAIMVDTVHVPVAENHQQSNAAVVTIEVEGVVYS